MNEAEDTSAIEITFPVAVNITRADQSALLDLVGSICRRYQQRHPDRMMWAAGFGAKITVNPLMLDDDEPIPFDESILHIECSERERYETDPPVRA